MRIPYDVPQLSFGATVHSLSFIVTEGTYVEHEESAQAYLSNKTYLNRVVKLTPNI